MNSIQIVPCEVGFIGQHLLQSVYTSCLVPNPPALSRDCGIRVKKSCPSSHVNAQQTVTSSVIPRFPVEFLMFLPSTKVVRHKYGVFDPVVGPERDS